MTTFDFFVGVFAIFGTFAGMVILADYIIPAVFPALFEEDGE